MTINSEWHALKTENRVDILSSASFYNQTPQAEEVITSIKQQLLLAKPSSKYVIKDQFVARATMAAQA